MFEPIHTKLSSTLISFAPVHVPQSYFFSQSEMCAKFENWKYRQSQNSASKLRFYYKFMHSLNKKSLKWMHRPRRHQLSSRQYSASSLRFYLKFMLFSFKIFSWEMRLVILKFRWRLNLVVFRSSYLPLRNRNGRGGNATCSLNHNSINSVNGFMCLSLT